MNMGLCMQVLCSKALFCDMEQTKSVVLWYGTDQMEGGEMFVNSLTTRAATFVEIPNIDPSKKQGNLSIIGLCHFNFSTVSE